MRRIIGLVASGLGTFLIVTALLIHFVVVGQVLKFPLGLYKILTFQGNNVSYFSSTQWSFRSRDLKRIGRSQ